jgi:hypothetical protein
MHELSTSVTTGSARGMVGVLSTPTSSTAPDPCLARENLREQIDELELFAMIDPDALADVEAVQTLIEATRSRLESGDTGPSVLISVEVDLARSAPAFVDGEVIDDGACRLSATVQFPRSYPSQPNLFVSLDTNTLQREVRAELTACVNRTLSEASGQRQLLQPLVAGLRETFQTVMREVAEEAAVAEADRQAANAEGEVDVQALVANERVLGRRCVYYHHIIGVGKRQCIASWARMFRINGFAKIGYPGILIVEGPECTIVEYVRWLQRLRWKLMVVRGEERISIDEAGVASLDDARVIPPHGVIEMADASEIAERCRTAGIEELFLTSMKKYR